MLRESITQKATQATRAAAELEKKGMGAGKTGPDLKDAVPEDRAALTTLGVKSCDSVSPPKSKFTRLAITS